MRAMIPKVNLSNYRDMQIIVTRHKLEVKNACVLQVRFQNIYEISVFTCKLIEHRVST